MEVYGSAFEYGSSFSWEEARNYSELSWSHSRYPQLEIARRKLYGVWTEGASPHHWIRFEEANIADRNVAFYKVGGALPSEITIARDGYHWHGDSVYMKVDYSEGDLTYRLAGFEPDSAYIVGIGFYQEEEPVSHLTVLVDGEVLGTFDVPVGEVTYVEESMPMSVTCDGEVIADIRNSGGGTAMVSHISIERDSRGGSGQQSVATRPTQDDLSVSVDAAPNPFSNSLTLTLGSAKGPCSILIYDTAGRLIERLPVTGRSIAWDGCDGQGRSMPTGIYFVRSEGMPRSECLKAIKIK
jgi:hypothetical protein